MTWLRKPHWLILISLVLATLAGLALQQSWLPGPAQPWVLEACRIAGEWFMRGLKMIIIPIVFTSMVCGIAGNGGMSGFGRLGIKTVLFYVGTTLLAAMLGLLAVNFIQPGLTDGAPNPVVRAAIQSARPPQTVAAATAAEVGFAGTLTDTVIRMVPSNIVQSAANTDMLGWIVFSLLFGLALAGMDGERGRQLRDALDGLNTIVLKITGWIMACAPIGVFALVTPVVAKTGGSLFQSLFWYFVTVLSALALHLFVVMPIILRLGGVSPLRHFRATRDALLTAFSTASSNATLPVTMRCVVEEAKVSPRVAGFTVPVGATVNMNGTALYECVAVIFVAQVLGAGLSLSSQLAVVFLALVSSVGVAGIPSASLVAIVMILEAVRIDGAGAAVAVLFSVDRLLDMSRTAVNVFGDTCGAVVIAKSEGENVLPDPSKDKWNGVSTELPPC